MENSRTFSPMVFIWMYSIKKDMYAKYVQWAVKKTLPAFHNILNMVKFGVHCNAINCLRPQNTTIWLFINTYSFKYLF